MTTLDPAQETYVERFGRSWETSGGSRTAGRIMGWLLICDPPQQSAANLGAALDVSHGSVSTLTRQLIEMNMVERVTFPGDRASYFKLRDNAWLDVMDRKMAGLKDLHELGEIGRNLTAEDNDHRAAQLTTITDFLLERWPALILELKQHVADHGDLAPEPEGNA
jgi:DNA-binding transcriptional regulator GbsR (MarR family)